LVKIVSNSSLSPFRNDFYHIGCLYTVFDGKIQIAEEKKRILKIVVVGVSVTWKLMGHTYVTPVFV